MAKPKPPVKVIPQPKKPVSGPEPVAITVPQEYDPSKDRHALRQIIARRGAVDAAQRDAFDDLVDDATRLDLSAETRPLGVFRDAMTWAVEIDRAFTQYPAVVEEHYGMARFTYYLDRVAALDAAIEARQVRNEARVDPRAGAASLPPTPHAARKAQVAKLMGFAGGHGGERSELDVHATSTIGESLKALTDLGRAWIERDDEKATSQGGAGGVEAPLSPGEISAEVSLVAGTVLNEMEEAQRCFEEAHEVASSVPRLVPGMATRHLLSPDENKP